MSNVLALFAAGALGLVVISTLAVMFVTAKRSTSGVRWKPGKKAP